MNRMKNNSGFTLLEIIIVIIIVGVLASLALPRLFSTIEFSRSTEAFSSITSIRSSMERCYLMNNETYQGCGDTDFDELDIDDPATSPNAHFTYGITVGGTSLYTITATRDASDGGNSGDTIVVTQTTVDITRAGTGAFEAIK